MTTANSVPLHSGVVAGVDERALTAPAETFRSNLARYRSYRRGLAELQRLDVRQLDDLGFAGLDLAAVARSAAQTR